MKKALFLLLLPAFLLLSAGCCRPASEAEPAPPPETEAPALTPAPEPWEPGETPAPLTYSWGGESLEAVLDGTWSWHDVTAEGTIVHRESAQGGQFQSADWLDGTYPILRAEGAVTLSFPCRMPDEMRLSAFCPWGAVPAELEGLTFTPYAGVNAYVLRAFWNKVDQGGSGGAYILLIEGACPSTLPETETALRANLLEADAWGCSFTLENGEKAGFRLYSAAGPGAWPLFRRTDFGGWEWVKPCRYAENEYPTCPGEGCLTLGLDWSRDVGTLAAGEYALLLYGLLTDGDTSRTAYLPLRFTLGEDALPAPPGPPSYTPGTVGFPTALTQLGQRRWTQTVTFRAEGRYIPDRDFTLFRREKDGSLTYIPPAWRLSWVLNQPQVYTDTLDLDVVLGSRYGALEAGSYVLRRRYYRLEEGESPGVLTFDRSWRTLPEERLCYADTPFSIGQYLNGVKQDTEPLSQPYTGQESELPISIRYSEFSSQGCRFTLMNLSEETLRLDGDTYTLYFFTRTGDWLPVALQRHVGSGLIPFDVPPGEGREWGAAFLPGREYRYASLARGTYRLVFSAALGEDRERRYTLAVEFAVREDGSGGYTGTLAEAKALILDYSRRLGEAAVWPEEVLQRKSWAYAYPMLLMGRDLYVGRWTVEQTRLGARVTVHRDRDLPRAEALLEGLSGLVVLRGEDFSPKRSPVTETNQGTGGTLRAELIPQTDPELYREGAWLLTLELREGTQADFYWCRNLWVERRDPDTGQWYALGYSGGYLLYETERTVFLEAGNHPLTVLSLGEFDAEFPPGGEYRFVLAFDTRPGTGDTLEYYTCPFVVTAKGEA